MAPAVPNSLDSMHSSEAIMKLTHPKVTGGAHEGVRSKKVQARKGSAAAKQYDYDGSTDSIPCWEGVASASPVDVAKAMAVTKTRGAVMMVRFA